MITERWAKPVNILGYEDSPRSVVYNGRVYCRMTWILGHDDVERVRLGRVCISDLEPQEEPYPERCMVCGFPMRKLQASVFEEFYEGEAAIGPTTSIAEEMEIAQELVDRGSG